MGTPPVTLVVNAAAPILADDANAVVGTHTVAVTTAAAGVLGDDIAAGRRAAHRHLRERRFLERPRSATRSPANSAA